MLIQHGAGRRPHPFSFLGDDSGMQAGIVNRRLKKDNGNVDLSTRFSCGVSLFPMQQPIWRFLPLASCYKEG